MLCALSRGAGERCRALGRCRAGTPPSLGRCRHAGRCRARNTAEPGSCRRDPSRCVYRCGRSDRVPSWFASVRIAYSDAPRWVHGRVDDRSVPEGCVQIDGERRRRIALAAPAVVRRRDAEDDAQFIGRPGLSTSLTRPVAGLPLAHSRSITRSSMLAASGCGGEAPSSITSAGLSVPRSTRRSQRVDWRRCSHRCRRRLPSPRSR